METTQQISENSAGREYIAFISYRHKPLDKQAAEKIQRAIEHYTVPREYRAQTGGKRLGKVFRDEDELPVSSSLSDSITYALDHSQYLIVICTPDLPKSAWCEQEIRYFTEKYGRDRVIAVLVDGQPQESFSPLLLHTYDEAGNITGDTEPLAANIAGKNHSIDRGAFRKEIVRVYASLIGCPFDALWQRERRRKMNRLFALVGASAVLLAGFSAVVLSKNAEITRQYDQIASQNEQITEQNRQITEQNDQITEQNEQITEQNLTLQRQLSSMQVDAGYTALSQYDIKKALESGLEALIPDEGGEELYDRRVRALFADALGAYDFEKSRTEKIYSQSVPITQLLAVKSEKKLLIADEVGSIHCIEVPSGNLLWEQFPHYSSIYDKSCELILPATNEFVLCKGSDFVSAYSLEDGTELWRYDYTSYRNGYSGYRGTGLRALSPDGKTLVLLDGNPDKEENSLLTAVDTSTGKKKAQIDLSSKDARILASVTDKWFYNTADFSKDGKRLAVAVFSQCLDENGEDKYIDGKGSTKEHRCDYYLIDTESWEILHDVYLDGFYNYGNSISYGCVLEEGTYNLLCAQYRSEFGGIVINTMNWEKEEYNTNTTTQTIPADDGIFYDDPYTNCAVPVLASGNRVAISSGSTLYLFNRDGTLYRGYAFTDAVLDAWWDDDVGQTITVLLASGAMIVYDSEKGYDAEDYSQGGVYRAQAFADGILDTEFLYDSKPDPDSMVVHTMREDTGSVLLTRIHTDTGRTELLKQPENANSYSGYVLLSPSGNRLFLFYYNSSTGYTVGVYDPVTYENLELVSFPELWGEPCVMDDTHFIIDNVIYGLDGSEETLKPQTGVSKRAFEISNDCESRILSSGKVLTVSEVLAGDTGMTYCWLDGVALEIDPKAGSSTKIPKSGANGLVIATPQGADQEMVVLDSGSGEIVTVENPYPASDTLLAIGTEKRVFAVCDRSQITVFNLETSVADVLDYEYAAREIQSLCFVPGDEYLLILTVSGRLDCWELSADTQVFSDTFKVYDTYAVSAWADHERDEIHVLLKSESSKYGRWIGIDQKAWIKIGESENVFLYLPQNGSLVEYNDEKYRVKEVYSLDRLAQIAREKLKG